MTRIRFEAADAVFEAFPALSGVMEARPAGERPEEFARALAAGENPFEALTFFAHLLPRREAVWWYCRALRSVKAAGVAPDDPSLALAQAWVKDPREALRLQALARVATLDAAAPASWAAIATAWSGGSLYIGDPEKRPEGLRPAAPDLVAQAVRAGLLLIMARVAPTEQPEVIRALLELGLAIAAGEGG